MRHRAVSVRQHGFLVTKIIVSEATRLSLLYRVAGVADSSHGGEAKPVNTEQRRSSKTSAVESTGHC